MKTRMTLIASLIFFLISSCGPTSKYLPKAGGKEGELLLVIDQKQWNGAVGDTLKDYLQQDFPGLPQPEPMFKLYRVFPQNFVRIFKTTNNIFMVNIDPERTGQDPTLEIARDSWARGQLVLRLNCSSELEFFKAFREKRERIVQLIRDRDIESLQKKFRVTESALVAGELEEKLNIYMTVPEGFYPNGEGENFYYLLHDAEKSMDGLSHQITRGIWAYSFPYTDPNTFTLAYAQHLRDSITSKYILGAVDSSYMVIETIYPPDSNAVTINDEYAMEMRGLWKMQNYFMGGAFINYTTYDKANDRIVMVDGYVFAPRFDKRSYMLQLEAILRSIKFI